MTAFGYLFYSERFHDEWAITELRKAVQLSRCAEPAYFVVQRLAALATRYPGPAIECMTYLVEGDEEGWGLNSWGLSIRTIIVAAMNSNAELDQRKAVELIHRLGARNHLEFQDLLPRRRAAAL